jgi:hypothetical protein
VTRRHVTTAVTLTVLCVLLVIAAVTGFNALFAPLPSSDSGSPSASPSPSCTPEPRKGARLTSREVQVSVFNAGDRSGLAGSTYDAFRRRGFIGGEVGNAPAGTKLRRAQVWIVKGEEDAGRLVALQLARRAKPHLVSAARDLSDGIDVVVGDGFRGLVKAPRAVKVTHRPTAGCS